MAVTSNETRIANKRLAQPNWETGMFATMAVQALRTSHRKGSEDVLVDSMRLLADSLEAYFKRGRPRDDDLYSDLVDLALDRIDWCCVAHPFVQDALDAEPLRYTVRGTAAIEAAAPAAVARGFR